jgi:hypothetical protein
MRKEPLGVQTQDYQKLKNNGTVTRMSTNTMRPCDFPRLARRVPPKYRDGRIATVPRGGFKTEDEKQREHLGGTNAPAAPSSNPLKPLPTAVISP